MRAATCSLILLIMLAWIAAPARAADPLENESLGGIKQGASQDAIVKRFGKPQSKTAEILEGATGLYVQTWTWSQLSIKMSSPKKGGAKVVDTIETARPSLATARGIHVGSSAAEVRKAYSKLIDASSSNPSQIVVGSVYGGLIFTLQNGKVKRIFMGAAAE